MSRRQVALLCDYALLPDRIGGMDRFFWALHTAMTAAGWHVTWLFPAGTDSTHYQERNFTLLPLPKDGFLPAATAYLAAHPVDLLVSHFVPYMTRYSLDWRRAGVRCYIAVDHMSRPQFPRRRGQRARLAVKGLLLAPTVHQVVAVSGFVGAAVARELGPQWRRKTAIIANGVDTAVVSGECSVFSDGLNRPLSTQHSALSTAGGTDPLHLVIVAHLMAEKGIQVALAALAQARDELPPLRLSIAGRGPYAPELQAAVVRLGLADQVAFLGSITAQAALLRGADVALVPSLWQEACPFGVIEAMAAGLPVLASATGGVPELLGDTGILVPPGDVAAFAAGLRRLAGDAGERARLGRAAQARVAAHYTLPRMVTDHYTLLAQALGDR